MSQGQEAEEAVTKGIAWLERYYGRPWPELRQQFTRPVNVRNQQDCALAQLEGTNFSDAARRLGLSNAIAAELGFTVRYSHPYPDSAEVLAYGKMWPVLQAEWEKETRE